MPRVKPLMGPLANKFLALSLILISLARVWEGISSHGEKRKRLKRKEKLILNIEKKLRQN